MKMNLMGGFVAASTLIASASYAEDTVTAVHAFPETLIYTKSFLSFVDKVNEAGKGVVQIEVRGCPEAIGMFQQPDAVRDGIVDMVYTPGSFYGGALRPLPDSPPSDSCGLPMQMLVPTELVPTELFTHLPVLRKKIEPEVLLKLRGSDMDEIDKLRERLAEAERYIEATVPVQDYDDLA